MLYIKGISGRGGGGTGSMRILDVRELFAVLYDLALFSVMALIYLAEALILAFIPRRYRSKSLREEVALVTGAAGGIGRLIALKLASRGCSVVVWDINKTGQCAGIFLRSLI